ncbi:LMBR1 domain containing protein [Entamoeba marina]
MIVVVLAVAVVVVIISIIVSYFWVKHYNDEYDKDLKSNITTVVALSLVTSLLVIIPIDVYSAAETSLEDKMNGDASSIISSIFYYLLQLLSLLCVTCVAPYVYFAYEDEDEKDIPIQKKNFKNLLVIYIIGMFIPFTKSSLSDASSSSTTPLDDWINEIMPTSWFERGYQFLSVVISLFGCLFFLTYTAYGMADAGMSLLKNRNEDIETESLIVEQIEKIDDEIHSIREVHGEGRVKDRKARQRLARLNVTKRKLDKTKDEITGEHSKIDKILHMLRPFGIIFGLIFILFGAFIVVSILITQVVAVVKSSCGFSCGFVLDDPKSLNPMDVTLRMMSAFFPIDYLLFGVVIFFVVFSTLNGVRKIGIRILCIDLFDVKKKSTYPQALLLTSVIVTFTTYAFINLLGTLMPIYSTFGNQYYTAENGDSIQCSLEAPVDKCKVSRVGKITLVNSFGYNYFAVLNYFIGWLFCIAWGCSLALSFFMKKKKHTELEEELI